MSAIGEDEAAGGVQEVHPILDTDLPVDLERSFDGLIDETYNLPRYDDLSTMEAAYENFCNQVQQEVTAHPVLAKAVSKDLLHWSLLTTLCEKTSVRLSHPAIMFLIEQNPHALVWQQRGVPEVWKAYPIYSIARDRNHCVLMPWIADHFAWVLDHPVCQEIPPHLELVKNYANGECDASVIRRFYELYPQGLGQEHSLMEDGLPLHRCLVGWEECEADLIKWMTRQYPDSMSYQDRFGFTPLHCACQELSSNSTDNMVEICRFLATECPNSVRVFARFGCLPIHLITKRSNRSAVQNVLLTLLREYPQSIDKSAENCRLHPHPRSVPFIQRVETLLQEELALKEDMAFLTETSAAWCEAMRFSNNVLQVSASNVFKRWAAIRKQTFTHLLAQIPEHIMEVCHECEGEDEDEDDDSDDVLDGEDVDEDDDSEIFGGEDMNEDD